jgi:hypothetical protein
VDEKQKNSTLRSHPRGGKRAECIMKKICGDAKIIKKFIINVEGGQESGKMFVFAQQRKTRPRRLTVRNVTT